MDNNIPRDLEQYSRRLTDFCESLSVSAYVNFQRLFLMRVVRSNPSKTMLNMYAVWLQSLLTGSRRNVSSLRIAPTLQDYRVTTYKPFDMPSPEELEMMGLLDMLLSGE